MKKLLLTLLISLNLAMPAHATGAGVFVTAGLPVVGIAVGGLGLGTTYLVGFTAIYTNAFSTTLDKLKLSDLVPEIEDLKLSSLIFPVLYGGVILDAEKNSENNLIRFDLPDDVDSLIAAKIYTETEGNALKSEWKAFKSNLSESEKELFFINLENTKDMSPEELIAAIQSQVGDRKLLAEYLASKVGIQVQ